MPTAKPQTDDPKRGPRSSIPLGHPARPAAGAAGCPVSTSHSETFLVVRMRWSHRRALWDSPVHATRPALLRQVSDRAAPRRAQTVLGHVLPVAAPRRPVTAPAWGPRRMPTWETSPRHLQALCRAGTGRSGTAPRSLRVSLHWLLKPPFPIAPQQRQADSAGSCATANETRRCLSPTFLALSTRAWPNGFEQAPGDVGPTRARPVTRSAQCRWW